MVGRRAFESAFFTKTGIYRCIKRASDATRQLEARLSRERIQRRTLSLFNFNRPCIRNPSYAPPRCRYYAPPLVFLHQTFLYVKGRV